MATLGTDLAVNTATALGTDLEGSALPAVPTTNLLAGWRADLGYTIDTGVSQWLDWHNSHPLVQSTASAQPSYQASVAALNGKPALRFDGVNDYLASSESSATWKLLSDGSGHHVFVVSVSRLAKPSADGARDALLATTDFTNAIGFVMTEIPSTSTLGTQVYNGATFLFGTTSIASVWAQDTARWVEAMYVEGRAVNECNLDTSGGTVAATGNSAAAPSSSNPLGTLHVGCRVGLNNFANHDIAEILIYSAEQTGASYTQIINYLNTRYGTST